MTLKQINGLLHVRLVGKISRHVYDGWIREIARLAGESGKVRMLAETGDFDGWDFLSSFWDESGLASNTSRASSKRPLPHRPARRCRLPLCL
jgi:hypothetical protein